MTAFLQNLLHARNLRRAEVSTSLIALGTHDQSKTPAMTTVMSTKLPSSIKTATNTTTKCSLEKAQESPEPNPDHLTIRARRKQLEREERQTSACLQKHTLTNEEEQAEKGRISCFLDYIRPHLQMWMLDCNVDPVLIAFVLLDAKV